MTLSPCGELDFRNRYWKLLLEIAFRDSDTILLHVRPQRYAGTDFVSLRTAVRIAQPLSSMSSLISTSGAAGDQASHDKYCEERSAEQQHRKVMH